MRIRAALPLAIGCIAAVFAAGCGGDADSSQRAPANPFVISGGRAPATLWAIGDAGHLGERERPVARLIAGASPDRLLYLGDVYETGTAKEFRAYDSLYGTLAPLTAPVPGNHDWPNHERGYDPYWERRKGRAPPPYYSFRIAGWQLIGLNSQLFGDDFSRQVSWLHRAVTGPGDCRLGFWHEPRFSAGSTHGDESRVEPLWQALGGKAALVVNGHEHNMQRLLPVDGIVELISGAGGHGNHYGVEDDSRLAFSDDEHDGALRISLKPGRARLEFVAVGGEVLDSSTVRCSEG